MIVFKNQTVFSIRQQKNIYILYIKCIFLNFSLIYSKLYVLADFNFSILTFKFISIFNINNKKKIIIINNFEINYLNCG